KPQTTCTCTRRPVLNGRSKLSFWAKSPAQRFRPTQTACLSAYQMQYTRIRWPSLPELRIQHN
ncbi:hypothetical protein GGH17_004149, partial [Coemansia sp. RSA 788]